MNELVGKKYKLPKNMTKLHNLNILEDDDKDDNDNDEEYENNRRVQKEYYESKIRKYSGKNNNVNDKTKKEIINDKPKLTKEEIKNKLMFYKPIVIDNINDISLGTHIRYIKTEENLCVVCTDVESNMIFIPCGHLCMCNNCMDNYNSKKCPICRSTGNYLKVLKC